MRSVGPELDCAYPRYCILDRSLQNSLRTILLAAVEQAFEAIMSHDGAAAGNVGRNAAQTTLAAVAQLTGAKLTAPVAIGAK